MVKILTFRRNRPRWLPTPRSVALACAVAAIAGALGGGLVANERGDRLSGLPSAIAGFLSSDSTAHAQAGDLVGSVTRVRDGDTIEVEGQAVRLNGLHAPEMSEPGGRDARRFMVNLVEGRTVACELTGERSYDRQIGRCFLDDRDIAIPLIQAGLGRDCPRYSGGRYRQYETDASRRLELPGYC